MDKKIKCVCWDFNEVLGTFNWFELGKYFHGKDKCKFYTIFLRMAGVLRRSKEFKDLCDRYQAGEFSKEELLEKIGANYPSLVDVLDVVLLMLPETFSSCDQMIDYVIELNDKVEKQCILTNSMPENIDKIEKTIRPYVDDIVYSTEIGRTKKDPEAFVIMAARMGLKPEEILFIDDKKKYCKVAQSLGMSTIVFKNPEQCMAECNKILNQPQEEAESAK